MDTGWKRYTFYINSTAHADMRIKLRYDDIPQQTFFKMLIKAYIEDNPHMRELIKELNSERLGKRSLKKMKKDENLTVEQEDLFGLTEEEVSDIYDQIEMDDNNE
jgi:hypothetical protein